MSFGKSLHFEIFDGGVIKDNQEKKLKEKLKKYLSSDADIFATSGAISAGKFDFIPELIKTLGFKSTLFFSNMERAKIASYHDIFGVGKRKITSPFFSIGDKEEVKLQNEFAKFYFKEMRI